MTRRKTRQEIRNGYLTCSWGAACDCELRLAAQPDLPLARAALKISGDTPVFSVMAGKNGLRATAQTPRYTVTIDSRPVSEGRLIRQDMELVARKDGVVFLDEIRYEIRLCPAERDPQVFIPTHWAFLGTAKEMPAIDTYYHHFTIFDGYKNQIRTPAVSVWGRQAGVTAALPTPLAHMKVSARTNANGTRTPCFSFSFEKPAYGPDHYLLNPWMKKGETLKFSVLLHPHTGDWQAGMKQWMGYNMRHFIKDDFPKVAWLDDVRIIWIKWEGTSKSEIDALARMGVKVIELYPWTEPSAGMLRYIHSKGMKVVMEHYMLSSYEIRPDEKTIRHIRGGERYRSRTTSKRVADRHPDWVLKLLPGDEGLHDIYIHMDPHVKGFREAKVKEAVALIKKGFDGLRYDNLILPNGISQGAPYTTTYATAMQTMLREIKTAIRKINPNAVIMANNAGPDVFNLTDLNMYEAGLSSESHMMEQAGRTDWEKSNYDRAHLRMLTAKCIWQFAGKPLWVWDYPKGKTSKELEKLWILRSILFDLLHDAIIGLAIPEDLKPIEMASEMASLVREPLGEIVAAKNLVVRFFRPGVILAMETRSQPWQGTVRIPEPVRRALPQPAARGKSFRLFSEKHYGLKCARLGAATSHGVQLKLAPDGCAVITMPGAGR